MLLEKIEFESTKWNIELCSLLESSSEKSPWNLTAIFVQFTSKKTAAKESGTWSATINEPD